MVCVCISDYERYCTVFLLNSYMWKVELSCYSRQLASSIGSFVLQDSPFSFPFCKCVLSNFPFLIVWPSIITSWFCLLVIQFRGWSELMHVILFSFRNNLTFIIACLALPLFWLGCWSDLFVSSFYEFLFQYWILFYVRLMSNRRICSPKV